MTLLSSWRSASRLIAVSLTLATLWAMAVLLLDYYEGVEYRGQIAAAFSLGGRL